MAKQRYTRRQILKAGGAAMALPLMRTGPVLGVDDQVKIAIIGLGGRAGGVCRETGRLSDRRIVAVSDCFKPRIARFIKSYGKEQGWKGYEDFRKMIEKEKPEGVMIETTTHARAWIAVLAMQMGCDAYIEKPMSLTIAEGRYMARAARKYNRITQVGTQQRSIDLNNEASDLVKNGALGKVHTVLAPNFVGPVKWTEKPAQPMPEGAGNDWWDVWTNQAVMRPYHRNIHYGWAKWWAYDGGGLCFGVTGWGAHSYDQVNRGLGTHETGPVEVVLEEPVRIMKAGKFDKPAREDDTGRPYHHMAKGVTGPRAKVTMKFASGTKLKLHLDGDRGPGLGAIFIGEKGSIEINRNMISSDPKELTKGLEPRFPGAGRGTALHVRDWLKSIRSRKPCNAPIEYGQRSTTLCYLANIAREVGEVGKKLKWDPKSERFTNSEKGNKLLDRERRKGWELPPLT